MPHLFLNGTAMAGGAMHHLTGGLEPGVVDLGGWRAYLAGRE